jgi:imidazolonepropionase
MTSVLFRNAEIFTPVDEGRPLQGNGQSRVRHIEKGAVLCRDGVIEEIGPEKEVLPDAPRVEREVDCDSRCLIPGFVDPHTHMCFAKRREKEFLLRLEGVAYLEILRQGGGILSSVRAVRAASEEELFQNTLKHALSALRHGTTTVEIKSGYGLDTPSELKMLRVIRRVADETPLDVVPTFLGAHAVPEEYRGDPERYVELLVGEMIPAVARQSLARFCDIFCEEGVFSVDQSRRILQAAAALGMRLKIHADEVHPLGGAGLAAEVRAVSAEHLLAATDPGLQAMARAGTIACLLPATAYSLRKPYARARAMIDLGVPVALATDCNPGSSYTESMPFAFGLGVLNLGLSIQEALVASTLNAAYALGMNDRVGSLDVGKSADLLLLDGETPAILAYHAGVSPVVEVYKRGERVYRAEDV